MATNKPKVETAIAAKAQGVPLKPKKLANLGVLGKDKPSWRFALMDFECLDEEWGWHKITEDVLYRVIAFLQQTEKLTWTEIRALQTGGSRRRGALHKYVPIEHCHPAAIRKLTELELDEYNEEWFRFRNGGTRRIWGVVDEDVFYPVWWDPDHRVCPGTNDPD